MRSVAFLLSFVVLCLFSGTSQADTCLETPNVLTKGQSCGNVLSCKRGYYCNNMAQCAAYLTAGQTCLDIDGECGPTATCVGVTSRTCVVNVNPGEACDDPSIVNTTLPYCPSGSCDDNICTGGQIGDKCTYSSSVSVCIFGLNCTEGICTAIPQSTCFGDESCNPTDYCYFGNSTCLPKLPEGANCDFGECQANFTCGLANQNALTQTCIAQGSVANGWYCSNNFVCASQYCLNSFCVAEAKVYCTSQSQCSNNQLCLCDGSTPQGIGKCATDPCLSQATAFYNCEQAYCPDADPYEAEQFSGSCLNNNCAQQLQAYLSCSPANFIAPFMSLTIISLSFLLFFIAAL